MAVAEAVGASEPEGSMNRDALAKALGTTSKSSTFTTILNSSAKYGLTLGGYKDERIRLTSRGFSVVAPTRDQERTQALSDAALEPEVFSQFYEIHDGSDLPDDTYCKNILQRRLSIQAELTNECLEIVKANGVYVGLLKDVRGKLKVDVTSIRSDTPQPVPPQPTPARNGVPENNEGSSGRVFVGHWGDPDAAQFVTKTLADFHIPYTYLVGLEPDGRPVHAKITEEMQKSAAAIFVFAESEDSADAQLDREQMIYQLGASSVLFGDKVVVFQSSEGKTADEKSSGRFLARTVLFRQGNYDEAGLELVRELFQSGIIRVGV